MSYAVSKSNSFTVPLRAVIVALVILVGVGVGTATLVPTFDAASTTTDANMQMLRTNTMARIHQSISAYFQDASGMAGTLQSLFQNGILKAVWAGQPYSRPQSGQLDGYETDVIFPGLCATLLRDGFETYFGTDDGRFLDCSGPTVAYRNLTTGRMTQVATYLQDPITNLTVKPSASGGPSASASLPPPTVFPIMEIDADAPTDLGVYDPRVRPWYAALKAKPSWSPVYVNFFFQESMAAITVGGPLVFNGRVVGAVARDVGTQSFRNLTSTGLSPHSIAVVLEASTGLVLSTSWTTNVVKMVGKSVELLNITELGIGASLPNRIIRNALKEYPWAVLASAPLPANTDTFSGVFAVNRELLGISSVEARDQVRMFVDMRSVRDEMGLNLRLIVITPEVDFNAGFFRIMNTTLIIITFIFAAFVIFAGVVAYWLLRPLHDVAQSMRVLDSLMLTDNDNDDIGGTTTTQPPPVWSRLSEVRLIQVKYAQLSAQLRKVCSFLPRAVVDQLLRVDEDPNRDEEDDLFEDEADDPVQIRSAAPWSPSRNSVGFSTFNSSHPYSASHQSDSSSYSHRGDASGGAADAIGRLESHMIFVTKRVTVLAVNIYKFHATSSTLSAHQLNEALAGYTRLLCRVAEEQRGVLHSLHGDHAVLSFNASTRCPAHCEHGVLAAYHLAQRFAGTQRSPMERASLTMGLATGLAVVGQAGTDMFKQFAIIGPVYKTASFLERLCKKYDADAWPSELRSHRCLMDRHTQEQSEAVAFSRAMDIVPLMHRHGTLNKVEAAVISSIHGLTLMDASSPEDPRDDGEWMYEMKRAQDKDPNRDINRAFMAVCFDSAVNATSAVESVAGLRETSQHRVSVLRLQELMFLRQSAADDPAVLGRALLQTLDYGNYIKKCL